MEDMMDSEVCWQCNPICSTAHPFLNWVRSCKPGIQFWRGSSCLPVPAIDINYVTDLEFDVLVFPVVLFHHSMLCSPNLVLEVFAMFLPINEVLEMIWVIDSQLLRYVRIGLWVPTVASKEW